MWGAHGIGVREAEVGGGVVGVVFDGGGRGGLRPGLVLVVMGLHRAAAALEGCGVHDGEKGTRAIVPGNERKSVSERDITLGIYI